MLNRGRTPKLGSFPAVLRPRPVVSKGLINSAYRSSNAKRYNSKDNHDSKEPKRTDDISSYEYTQPLSGELQNIERFADEIDNRLNNQIEVTISKHPGEHLNELREMIKKRLHNYDIKNEAFTNVNKALADKIKYTIKDLNFEIHYPSREQLNEFALYTTKLFVYVDMILVDSEGKEGVIFDEGSKFLKHDATYKVAEQISQELKNDEVDKDKLFKIFIDGWLVKAKESNDKIIAEIKKDEKVLETISNPLNWFTKTKLYKRKFFLHVGPTNSGKTHTALNLLKESRSRSFYAGPLRLLAKEIYDKFNYEFKIPCNLLTGEKVINVIDPQTGGYANISAGTTDYIARTIESQKEYDIVVVDEAQLINEEFRGGSILNIILGCKAKHIHLCGEPRFVPIVKKLCELMNDDVEVIEYTRRSTLKLSYKEVPHLRNLQAGDCLIDSSRRSILTNKHKVEKIVGVSAATIYGGQPLSIRAFQAHLFNTRKSPILVASNAIGIGMNLNIDKIVFNTLRRGGSPRHPTSGAVMKVYFPDADIKQMAGRAGRNKSFGTVTTMRSRNHDVKETTDHQRLTRILSKENDPITEVFASPPMQIVSKRYEIFKKRFDLIYGIVGRQLCVERAFHDYISTIKFKQLLAEENVALLMLRHQKGPSMIFDILADKANMTFLEKISLSFIPLKVNNRIELEFFKKCARLLDTKSLITMNNCGLNFEQMKRILRKEVIEKYARSDEVESLLALMPHEYTQDLQHVECISRCLTALLWLNNRYPNRIINVNDIEDLLVQCDLIMHYIQEVETKTVRFRTPEYENKGYKNPYKTRSNAGRGNNTWRK